MTTGMNLVLIDKIFIKATNKMNTLILLYLLQLFILKIKKSKYGVYCNSFFKFIL